MEKEIFGQIKKPKLLKNKKIKFHLDDKGRKIYDVSSLNISKESVEVKNKIPKQKEELTYLKKREMGINEYELTEDTNYHCKICNCSLKDNQAYLDHINGKRHNQMLGMNMKVENVGVDRVRERLLNLKRRSEKSLPAYKAGKMKFDNE